MTPALNAALAGLVLAGTLAALAVAEPSYPEIPDPALTPGRAATTDVREVCAFGGAQSYSQAHRATTTALKDWIFREYGMTPPRGQARRDWEIDHLIPLCLGGADEAANLWPQHRTSFPRKDALEAHACREVCRGRVGLAEAQAWFAGDWRIAWRREIGR